MAGRVFIGTSGWAYKSWGEIFYPAGLRPAHQLGYYASRFPTVEINASFYRLPGLDAFSEAHDWYATSHLAIDQGPIIVMIENYRTGLLWRLFMSCPEIQGGLRRLGFASPHLRPPLVS